jgi:polar amino acid transport system permease protein
VGLTVYVVAALVGLLFAKHGSVRAVFFAWSILTDGGAWKSMIKGFWINIQVFLIAEVIVLVWALFVAVVRLLPGPACRPLRFLATVYVDAFRAFPAILVVYIVGLGLPQAKLPLVGHLSDMQYVIFALSLTYGAYVSEVYRVGIESIHWSQVAAARSLGLSYSQTMRFVVVPQAVRRVVPPLLNDFIGLQKDTAIISVIGVLDVVSRARFINNAKGSLTAYSMAALLFLLVTIPFTRWLEWLQNRRQARTQGGR